MSQLQKKVKMLAMYRTHRKSYDACLFQYKYCKFIDFKTKSFFCL